MTSDRPLATLRCPRCDRIADPADRRSYLGCPECRLAGVPVNFVCDVPEQAVHAALHGGPTDAPGLWRWGAALPVDARYAVSLGEGSTPLLPLPALGRHYGMPLLYGKNETVNPTWSHKDRLCALAVAAARAVGADTVAGASTGNHGAALAAYAARAGLRCVIFTLTTVPETMKTLMLSYGAEVVAVPESNQRYPLLAEGVERNGWFAGSNGTSPPVGSTPYGVDGYKTLAYELWEQLGGAIPDVVVFPVTYADCLSGAYRGFVDLRDAGLVDRVPRLIGAEIFTALGEALRHAAHGDDRFGPVPTRGTAAFSISGAYTTWQAVHAVRASDGQAVTVSEEDMLATQHRIASSEGLFVEASSAVGVAAAGLLARAGLIGPEETVVCLLTASGLKDPSTARRRLPDIRTAPGNGKRPA
jgi:threonine synthase